MVTINPKCLTLGELYGQFDPNTLEWVDGILSTTVRQFVKHNTKPVSSNPASGDKEEQVTG